MNICSVNFDTINILNIELIMTANIIKITSKKYIDKYSAISDICVTVNTFYLTIANFEKNKFCAPNRYFNA